MTRLNGHDQSSTVSWSGHAKAWHSHISQRGHAMELVLSLFPGADFLGRGFESLGFSVVRGPDTLLDLYIEDFHAVESRFFKVLRIATNHRNALKAILWMPF